MKKILITLTIIILCFSGCSKLPETNSSNTTNPSEITTEKNPNITYEATLKSETDSTTYTIYTENGNVIKVIMHKEFKPAENSEYDSFTYEENDAKAISKANGIEKTVSSEDDYKTIKVDMTIDYSKLDFKSVQDIIFSDDLFDDELMFKTQTFEEFKSYFLGGYEIVEK